MKNIAFCYFCPVSLKTLRSNFAICPNKVV